jgi:hypothetical protein
MKKKTLRFIYLIEKSCEISIVIVKLSLCYWTLREEQQKGRGIIAMLARKCLFIIS